jgi:dTDP-4-dehydrorhamnose reductase
MSSNKTILVTGANGQLGSELKAISSSYPSYNFLFVGKYDLPIDDYIAVENFFQNNTIDICINCAAYTAVDKAESEPDKAFAINAHGASNLATQCQYYKAQLIHISTDYVFNGTATQPIKEDEPTDPIGVYGQSKLKGEDLVLQVNPTAIIIRTSWVYSSFGNNFVKTMLRLMNEKESINVVNDQIGKPTYARDLAEAIMKLVEKYSTLPAGRQVLNIKSSIFNYSNAGATISWYNFALAINKKIKSKCLVNAIPTSAYPTPAKRPAYSVLDTTKIENELGITIANWEDGLDRCLKLLNS